ncbi:hypothetical protein H5410_064374 [Solanum commersonii]|uniref:Uncharacterized protein n=1 Tax=Solanum commersonii TaxID=4109 RepID=A0A9J5W095_SOLCO|nr:hypothetical protein H5410_064374 [Solanum commersonii]
MPHIERKTSRDILAAKESRDNDAPGSCQMFLRICVGIVIHMNSRLCLNKLEIVLRMAHCPPEVQEALETITREVEKELGHTPLRNEVFKRTHSRS